MGRSGRDAVADVHDTVADQAIVYQIEGDATATGQRGLASADEDGADDQMALIDKRCLESGALRVARPPR